VVSLPVSLDSTSKKAARARRLREHGAASSRNPGIRFAGGSFPRCSSLQCFLHPCRNRAGELRARLIAMPRSCLACAHAERTAIDNALAAGQSFRDIAGRFSLSRSALHRHKDHVAQAIVEASEKREEQLGENLLASCSGRNYETPAKLPSPLADRSRSLAHQDHWSRAAETTYKMAMRLCRAKHLRSHGAASQHCTPRKSYGTHARTLHFDRPRLILRFPPPQ
jgi:hypothetical protein